MLFITGGPAPGVGGALHSGPLSNISIVAVGNPARGDNAWNGDHSQNVYAWRRIVKLQAWDCVSSIYCLCYTAVVLSLSLSLSLALMLIAV